MLRAVKPQKLRLFLQTRWSSVHCVSELAGSRREQRLLMATDPQHLVIPQAGPSSTPGILVCCGCNQALSLRGSIQMFHGTSSPTHNSCFSLEFWSCTVLHDSCSTGGVSLTVYHWIHFDSANANKDHFHPTGATES